MKVAAKKNVERRQLEHGILPLASKKTLAGGNPTMTRGLSVDQRTMLPQLSHQAPLDKDGAPLEIKIIKVKEIDDLSEIQQHDDLGGGDARRLSLLPADEVNRINKNQTLNKNNVLKQLKEF